MIKHLRLLISLFCFFILIKTAVSQVPFVNTASHSFHDIAEEIVTVDNFNFVESHVYSDNFIDTSVIAGFDQFGNRIFRQTINIPLMESTYINKMVRSKENYLTFCGFARGCDYVSNQQKLFVTQIDSNGTTLFNNVFTNPYPVFNPNYFTGMVQANDSSYYIITDSLLYHFSKTGGFINVKNTGFTECSSIILLNNSNFLISAKTGTVAKLAELNPAAAIVSQTNCPYSFTKFIMNGSGALFGITTTGFAAKIAGTYSITGTTQISQGSGNTISDLINENDTLYCSGYSSANQFLFYKYDSGLNQTYTKVYNSKHIYPVKLSVNKNKNVIFLNSERQASSFYSNSYQSLILTNKMASFSIGKDAGVTDHTLDTGYASVYYSPLPPYPVYLNFRLKVKVFNFSATDTLRSFFLNYKSNILLNCGIPITKSHYSGLAIPPNTFTYVTTPWILDNAGIVTTTVSPGTMFSIPNACIWTSAPDYSSDFDHTNDQFCKNTSMPYVLGVNPVFTEKTFEVFPNPFSSEINIKASGDIEKIELFSIQGKLLRTMIPQTKNETVQIVADDLSDGFYLLKLYGEHFTKTVKVIKH